MTTILIAMVLAGVFGLVMTIVDAAVHTYHDAVHGTELIPLPTIPERFYRERERLLPDAARKAA